MARIATFSVTGNGEATLLDSPVNYLISQKGGVHEVVVEGGPITGSVITPYLAIPGRTFVPILENNSPLVLKIGARPFFSFLVGLQIKIITSSYDDNPVTISLWL